MASSSVRRIDLVVDDGAERRLPLTSAGSVGYDWRIAVVGDAVDARIVSEPPPDAPAGGSVPLFLAVRGIHPGSATINLTLVRDPAAPPREAIEVAVTVAPRS